MKVLAALSGGVDSSVMAALLLEAGHEVVGATMKLWGGESDSGCCSVSDVEDARRAAAQLGVDHHVFNFGEEFTEHVVSPYVSAHSEGLTPNPCIECNRHLKFDVLVRRAEMLGFDAVATGHHARVVELGDGTRRVGRGHDDAKDQSYVLYTVRSEALDGVLFPIGELTKAQVRDHAARLGLRTAHKAESQDVCFITKTDGRRSFLSARTDLHPAKIVDETGVEVGMIDSIEMVTVGQRRGLNLAGGAHPRYVTDVDTATSTVTIGPRERLLTDCSSVDRVVWAAEPIEGDVMVQCSAHGRPEAAVVDFDRNGSGVVIRWTEPHRRVAPGQSVVMYRTVEAAGVGRDVVVGGGISLGS